MDNPIHLPKPHTQPTNDAILESFTLLNIQGLKPLTVESSVPFVSDILKEKIHFSSLSLKHGLLITRMLQLKLTTTALLELIDHESRRNMVDTVEE